MIIDDMIDTGGTLCAAAEQLKERGAADIYALATHGLLSGPAIDRFKNSVISKVVVTNTLPLPVREADRQDRAALHRQGPRRGHRRRVRGQLRRRDLRRRQPELERRATARLGVLAPDRRGGPTAGRPRPGTSAAAPWWRRRCGAALAGGLEPAYEAVDVPQRAAQQLGRAVAGVEAVLGDLHHPVPAVLLARRRRGPRTRRRTRGAATSPSSSCTWVGS